MNYKQAVDDDGKANDGGEKSVRESSTQYLQISSQGKRQLLMKCYYVLL